MIMARKTLAPTTACMNVSLIPHKALDVYVATIAEARVLVAALAKQIEAHQDARDHEQIHWGDVGDMEYVVNRLKTLLSGMKRE